MISLELPVRLVRVPPTPAAQAAELALGSPKPASPTKVTKGGARGLTGVLFLDTLVCMVACRALLDAYYIPFVRA